MAETTFNSTTEEPFDYKKAVEEGLRDIDAGLHNIQRNQAETAKLKTETREIAKRLDDLLKTF